MEIESTFNESIYRMIFVSIHQMIFIQDDYILGRTKFAGCGRLQEWTCATVSLVALVPEGWGFTDSLTLRSFKVI